MSNKGFNLDDNGVYEDKLIFNLVFDKDFLDKVSEIMMPEFFDGFHRKWLVRNIIRYHQEKGKPVTPTSILLDLQKDRGIDKENPDPKTASVLKFWNRLKDERQVQKMTEDSERVQEHALEFFKTKMYVNAIKKCANLLEQGREEEIATVMSEVDLKTDHQHVGTDYFDMDFRKEKKAREDVIETPWKPLNKYIKGVGKNELCTWIAGMGSGKSTTASNLAINAMRQGKNVVLYTLELGEGYNVQRADSIFLGEESDGIELMYDKLEKELEDAKKAGGSLTIKKFPTGITCHTIKNHFKKLRARGKAPDMFIIDYTDLMDSMHKYNNQKKDWEKFGEITKEIRDEICFKEDVAGHAFLQGNTTAIDEFVITASSSSGGARRLFSADIVLGLARPPELKAMKLLNLSIIKNRFGKDGFYMEANTDYSIGMIELIEGEKYDLMDSQASKKQIDDSLKDELRKYQQQRKKTQASKRVKTQDEISFN